MEQRKLLTAAELARLLGLSAAGVRRYARLGKLPYYRIGGLMRFDPDDVLRAIKQTGGDDGGGAQGKD